MSLVEGRSELFVYRDVKAQLGVVILLGSFALAWSVDWETEPARGRTLQPWK